MFSINYNFNDFKNSLLILKRHSPIFGQWRFSFHFIGKIRKSKIAEKNRFLEAQRLHNI